MENICYYSDNKVNKKNYDFVDLIKLIFAILILMMHCSILKENWFFTKLIVRLGVPFFFIASGYFYGKKALNSCTNLKSITFGKNSSIRRLALMLVVFEPIALILYGIRYVYNGLSISDIIINMIKHVFFYPPAALWYVQALIVALILNYILIKYNKIFLGIFLGLLLYFFALICNNYYFIFANSNVDTILIKYMDIFMTARNGLFVGFLFVNLGIIISKYVDLLFKNKFIIYIFFIISFVLLIIEILLINNRLYLDDMSLFLLTPITSFLLFVIAININVSIKGSIILRNLSTSIYLLHYIVMLCWQFLYSLLERIFNGFESNLYIVFISVCLSLVIFLFFVYKYKIKYIYKLII